MKLIIVTGMSGSGKMTALKFFEDNGFYCVDNLPYFLLNVFVELATKETSELNKVALVVDVRNGHINEAIEELNKLKEKGIDYEILFLETSDDVIIKRYKETRRLHPRTEQKSIIHGIRTEREELVELKNRADYIIDTSNLLVRDLKTEIDKIFFQNKSYRNLFVTILSFGFKHGVPSDCDLVFDVRFLPNPYYVPHLKMLTGNDEAVREFVMDSEVSHEFMDKLIDMMKFLIPNYINEGKNQLVIGIGCTGGHHRSVTVARGLYEALEGDESYGLKLSHRDINR